jgi:hypothetical protein
MHVALLSYEEFNNGGDSLMVMLDEPIKGKGAK